MPSTARRGGRVNRERRACGRVIRINAISRVPVVVPVVVMLSAPEPLLSALMPFTPPVVVAALIVRDVPSVYRINAIKIGTTCCRTRCCDAQCAGAIVVSINAIIHRPSWWPR